MTTKELSGGVLITECDIDLFKTFDCGQCFRFDTTDGKIFRGVACGRLVVLNSTEDGFFIENMNLDVFNREFANFLDLNRNYEDIHLTLSKSNIHKDALISGKGIHILRQDPWETLCSFIISQNNNIPRIKKIINALCSLCGDKIAEDVYDFPSAEKVAGLGIEGLAKIKVGFRDKYILDAAEKVASGKLNLDSLYEVSLDEAVKTLCTVKGVGPKVAGCVALFGLGHMNSFPVDVWIKKVIDKYYDESFTPNIFGEYAGIAQQYLFYHERYLTKQTVKN